MSFAEALCTSTSLTTCRDCSTSSRPIGALQGTPSRSMPAEPAGGLGRTARASAGQQLAAPGGGETWRQVLKASAHSPDGLVEAIEDPAAGFWLGVEWHPELLWDSLPRHRRIFEGLIAAAGKVAPASVPAAETMSGRRCSASAASILREEPVFTGGCRGGDGCRWPSARGGDGAHGSNRGAAWRGSFRALSRTGRGAGRATVRRRGSRGGEARHARKCRRGAGAGALPREKARPPPAGDRSGAALDERQVAVSEAMHGARLRGALRHGPGRHAQRSEAEWFLDQGRIGS